MNEILDPDALEALTGTPQAELQKEVLRNQGVRFLVTRKGKPVVIWEAVRLAMLSSETASNFPNFEALESGKKPTIR